MYGAPVDGSSWLPPQRWGAAAPFSVAWLLSRGPVVPVVPPPPPLEEHASGIPGLHEQQMMVIRSPLSDFLARWSSQCQVKDEADSADSYYQKLLFSVARGLVQKVRDWPSQNGVFGFG